MSYSRWSRSNWYAFSNINGCLSLWHVKGKHIDLEYFECAKASKEWITDLYECTSEDADEAMKYIGYYLEENTEEDCKKAVAEFQAEYNEFIDKLDKMMESKNE